MTIPVVSSKSLEDELPTLFGLQERLEPRPWRKVLAISVGVHLVLVFALRNVPIFEGRVHRVDIQTVVKNVTPLYVPYVEPTQKAPNKAKINREFDVDSLKPRPNIQIPEGRPSTTRPAARIPMPVPGAAEPPRLPEPPKIEAAAQPSQTPSPAAPGIPDVPPPKPPEQKAKIEFESVGAQTGTTQGRGEGRVPTPQPRSISELARTAPRAGGGVTVGDNTEEGIGGMGGGINLPPSPGRTGSNLELLSDPLGVDFRPYLVRVLASVRRNWQAVIPESARLGQRGRVVVQFAIDRQGKVPKLVISAPSGAPPLDRAAVAGISASNPFPPLPSEFRGEQIRLQFTFTYNQQASGIR